MNILIVEDNVDKKDYISMVIRQIDPTANIRWFNNYQDSAYFIDKNKDYMDYIVLDWSFPFNSYERCGYAMGRLLLDYMSHSHMNLKTIICSSDLVYVNNAKYPFVVDSILFENDKSLVDKFEIALSNKDSEEIKESKIRKCINKPDSTYKYKRKLSSTPWWMQ